MLKRHKPFRENPGPVPVRRPCHPSVRTLSPGAGREPEARVTLVRGTGSNCRSGCWDGRHNGGCSKGHFFAPAVSGLASKALENLAEPEGLMDT